MNIKLNCHSFIDIITNSSSEIYVTTTGKTVEFVKELLDCYIQQYKMFARYIYPGETFNIKVEDVFNITIETEYPYMSKEEIYADEYYLKHLGEDEIKKYFSVDVINILLKDKYKDQELLIKLMQSLQGILSSFDAKEISNEF